VPEGCVPLTGSPLSSGASDHVAVGPAPVVSTPELPRTGCDPARVLVAACALVAAGLVLLTARSRDGWRRRPRGPARSARRPPP